MNFKTIKYQLLLISSLLFLPPHFSFAQDTLQISLSEFIQKGINNSGEVHFRKQDVNLAENRVNQAKSQRILPKFDLNTQHGLVPGVASDSVRPNGNKLPKDEYYLDPNLSNDWENWSIFTRAEVNAIQPLFSWGAIDNAVKAAQAGAEAARDQFNAQKSQLHLKLYDLYYSYVLTLELERILDDAQSQINKIDDKIDEMEKKGNSDLDQSDVYKFKVYKSVFAMRAAEVKENDQFIKETWNYLLKADSGTVYEPEDQFLDPVQQQLNAVDFYKKHALSNRAEIQGIEAGIKAAKFGLKARKAQSYPMLFLGLTASYANTPNRPRQSNPFIINNTNYATAGFGLGIRQNLNFYEIKTDIQKNRIQYKKAKFLKDAAVDGIMLDIMDKYKEASLADVKVDKTDDAFVTSKKWLRQEQLDYDLGIGQVKDMVDALKTRLEMEVNYKRRIFEFNKKMAELYQAAGMPLTSLKMKN